ncbi:MAG: ATP-binding protein [Dysgonamonadaceae bacterium]|nr:ATP-binding protein [Dysgonamonadaceae bacterium]
MKKLPIGIQTFSELRTKDYLYIDKTEDIHRMITSGKPFFLSRPRRFGKSLLVSTLEEIFKGNKQLFEGLYIYDHWDWTQQHPVIRLDFGGRSNNSAEILNLSLTNFIEAEARKYGLSLTEAPLPDKFEELIKKLHFSTNRQVVVLIDEYDKPIIDNLFVPEIMEENKKILHNFYQILKAADEHLRFIFLTGVSKFAGVSIFSGLNNLNDITLDERYASLCGYTQQELETCFDEYLDDVAQHLDRDKTQLLNDIRSWYNGYSWDGRTSVYNPFSTLLLFDKRYIDNYWFRTGTPTFLIETLKSRNQIKLLLEPITVDSSLFESFDPVRINEIPLLFQTGYLTVKGKDFRAIPPQYILGIPNNEVKESLLKHLLSAYSYYPLESAQELRQRMQQQLLVGNVAGLEQSLREMLAYIPYPLHIGREAYYHSLMLLWLKLLGFDIIGEVTSNIGSIDAVWKFPGHTIVAEVKCQVKKGRISTLLTKAIRQIEGKRYCERFMNEPKTSLLAVVFAGKEIGCRMKVVK